MFQTKSNIALELNKVIKELLTSHNFISLPGLGSFVQSYEPAKLAADGKSFSPPSQSVSFDLNRTFNDEVLEVCLQDKLTISRTEAAEMVKSFVDETKEKIEKGQKVDFDSVGYLSRNEVGQIELVQADELERVSSTFGLQKVTAIEKRKPETHAKPTHIPKSTTVSSKPKVVKKVKGSTVFIAVLAAVIFLGIIVSGAFFLFPDLRFWEKSSTIALTTDTNQPKAEVDHDVDTTTITEAIDTVQTTDISQVVVAATDKKSALYYEEPVAQDQKTYYIIAGSFAKIENAQMLFNSLEEKGHKPEIVNSDGRFRVAISKFSDRNRALRELERLRREKPNDQVWLLGL